MLYIAAEKLLFFVIKILYDYDMIYNVLADLIFFRFVFIVVVS